MATENINTLGADPLDIDAKVRCRRFARLLYYLRLRLSSGVQLPHPGAIIIVVVRLHACLVGGQNKMESKKIRPLTDIIPKIRQES